MRKELEHTKRVKQLRDKENTDTENKRKERDARQQSARVHKYYDEYAVRQKSSMMKNKTREEQVGAVHLVTISIHLKLCNQCNVMVWYRWIAI